MESGIKVASVTLNWNGNDVLPRCIESLIKSHFRLSEIIVVDNGSKDGSIGTILQAFPEVVVIQNETNLGVGGGYNVGLKRALEKSVDYILTIDNDLFMDPHCLEELVSYSEENKNVGVIGAFIYDAGNTGLLLSAGGLVDYTQNVTRQLKVFDPHQSLIDVDFCGTGHRFTRRRVFDEIGLLDEDFIGYGYEDTDFSYRVRRAGYRVCTCPTARMWHSPHSNIGVYTFRKKYLETRNAILFVKKYGTFKNKLKYGFYLILGLPVAFLIHGIGKRRLCGVVGKIFGIVAGILNRKTFAIKLLR